MPPMYLINRHYGPFDIDEPIPDWLTPALLYSAGEEWEWDIWECGIIVSLLGGAMLEGRA